VTRVLLLTRYARRGASSRIRHLDLMAALEAEGFAFEHHALLDDDYLAAFYEKRPKPKLRVALSYLERLRWFLRRKDVDLVWLEKEALPWLPWVLERWLFARPGPPVIVDFDDNWPARYAEHRFPPMRWLGKRKFARLLQSADAVTAANAHLVALIAPLAPGRPIKVVHNGIDCDSYEAAAIAADRRRAGQADGRPLEVGWIGTTYTANAYLPAIADVLNRLADEGVIRTTLIGAGNGAAMVNARRVEWSESGEAPAVAALDVGLMPLKGDDFDEGKSGWKLVQFMAAGRPVVASPVGFNRDIVSHGVTGLLADDAAAFEAALRQLAGDPAARHAMGAAAAKHVRARFERRRAAAEVAALFRSVLASRSEP
jgi:glycosyltransferase involved in cell wall biosynthesis